MKMRAINKSSIALADMEAHPARGVSWIVDQAQGEQTYRNRVRCRNFAEDLAWLPC